MLKYTWCTTVLEAVNLLQMSSERLAIPISFGIKKIQFTSRLNILNQFLHLVMHIKWTEFIQCKQLLVAGCNNDLAGWLIFLEDKRTK